jgi:hypothetical protein
LVEVTSPATYFTYLGGVIAKAMSVSRYDETFLWRLSQLHAARYHVRILQVLDLDTWFVLFIHNKDKCMVGI